jgi:lipopolysaccharide export LptBFGC system permease protein LptF
MNKFGGRSMRPFTIVAALVFFIIAVAHLVRVILQVTVVVSSVMIPIWPSVLVFFLFMILGIMLLREGKQ